MEPIDQSEVKEKHLCVKINEGLQQRINDLHQIYNTNHLYSYLYLCLGTTSLAVGAWGWNAFLVYAQSHFGLPLTPESFPKLALPLFLWPLGGILLLVSANSASARRQRVALVSCVVIAATCTVYGTVKWAQPVAFFKGLPGRIGVYTGENPDKPNSIDMASYYVGQIVMATGLALTTVLGIATARLFATHPSGAPKEAEEPFIPSPGSHPDRIPDMGITARTWIFLTLYLPVCVLLTMALPSLWQAWSWSEDGGMLLKSSDCKPEAALCISVGFSILQLWWDVAIYYGFLYAICLVALVAHWSPLVRRTMHTSVTMTYGKHTHGHYAQCTLGGLLLVVALVTMLAIEAKLWYDHFEASGREPAEICARVLGQLSGVLLALLSLPAARTSVWSELFGVSWEAGIKTHIWLGYGLLGVSAAHMVAWWAVWAGKEPVDNGMPVSFSFPQDIFSIPGVYHADNWTDAPMTYVWFLMAICMGVLGHHKVRRARFELFYYSHHMFLVIYIAALMHGSSLWYYLLGSLSLWFLDRAVRFTRGCTPAHIAKLELCAGGKVSHLQVRLDGGASVMPGQYVFLNIPDVSRLEWHPFTVSDQGSCGELVFHVKAMGEVSMHGDTIQYPTTWTGGLARIAAQCDNGECNVAEVAVCVDGPYGVPVSLEGSSRVVYVAGGIGITPVHAMVRSRMRQGQTVHGVHLIWIVQSEVELAMLAESMLEMTQCGVMVSVFVTKSSKAASSQWDELAVQYLRSRDIDFRKLISMEDSAALGQAASQEKEQLLKQPLKLPLVFACGPAAMVERVGKEAFELGYDFHTETFEL